MWLDLILALALVFANALLVASEFALARLRTTHVAELEREGRLGAASLRHATAHLDAYRPGQMGPGPYGAPEPRRAI